MILKYDYNDEEINFEVIHRKRKTMCIKIEENGEVKVIVPLKAKDVDILKAVKPKSSWIITKRKEVLDKYNNRINRSPITGNTSMYLGEEYPLVIKENKNLKDITVEFINNTIVVHSYSLDESKLKDALEVWYRNETANLVKESINKYKDTFDILPTMIKVKEQKRRWGSCTSKRVLLFNWRISMAKREVIEYIVLHELCHMIQMNHSKYFWQEVFNRMPDYKKRALWLKEKGRDMTI